jgi:hypothetical protein
VVATPLGVVVGETVPHGDVAGEQESDQATPLLLGLLETTALSWAVAPGCSAAEEAEALTTRARSVTDAAPDLVVSLTEVTVIVTVRLTASGVDGAL